MPDNSTAIVTEASGGIGSGVVEAFLIGGYNVVATSLDVSQSLTASPRLFLVDGDIGKQETAAKVVDAAIQHFGTIDVLVNTAGIYRTKPFTDFTTEDFNALRLDQPAGIPLHHAAYREADAETEVGECCEHHRGTRRSARRQHKSVGFDDDEGGLNTLTRSLAIEYAKKGIRFNAVAPGVVESPLHRNDPEDFLKTFQPMGKIVEVKDVVDAVLYPAQAGQVTGSTWMVALTLAVGSCL